MLAQISILQFDPLRSLQGKPKRLKTQKICENEGKEKRLSSQTRKDHKEEKQDLPDNGA